MPLSVTFCPKGKVEGTWPREKQAQRMLLGVRLFVLAGALLIDCLILLNAGSIFVCLIGERAEKLFFTRQQTFLSFLERTVE